MLQDAIVEALLQSQSAPLDQLPWLHDLQHKLIHLQNRRRKAHANEESDSPEDHTSGQSTGADPLSADSSRAPHQQQPHALGLGHAQTASDSPDTSRSLHQQWQQFRLEVQQAVERQLVCIQHTAALQARTHLRMKPLAQHVQDVPVEQGPETVRAPLIEILTSKYLVCKAMLWMPFLHLCYKCADLEGIIA